MSIKALADMQKRKKSENTQILSKTITHKDRPEAY
jgi:hypothetical protein